MLCVIGAGLPRTGTLSLKQALPVLLGGKCYHMTELFDRPTDAEHWARALEGEPPRWSEFLAEYTAAVDWPSSALWPELSAAFPDAPVLLSRRADGATWYRSMTATVLQARREAVEAAQRDGTDDGRPGEWMMRVFGGAWRRALGEVDAEDRDGCIAAYDRYLDRVRDTVPADRLIDWQVGDGWEPLCRALDVPVPDQPFPHVNTTAQFNEMAGTRRLNASAG